MYVYETERERLIEKAQWAFASLSFHHTQVRDDDISFSVGFSCLILPSPNLIAESTSLLRWNLDSPSPGLRHEHKQIMTSVVCNCLGVDSGKLSHRFQINPLRRKKFASCDSEESLNGTAGQAWQRLLKARGGLDTAADRKSTRSRKAVRLGPR